MAYRGVGQLPLDPYAMLTPRERAIAGPEVELSQWDKFLARVEGAKRLAEYGRRDAAERELVALRIDANYLESDYWDAAAEEIADLESLLRPYVEAKTAAETRTLAERRWELSPFRSAAPTPRAWMPFPPAPPKKPVPWGWIAAGAAALLALGGAAFGGRGE